MTDINECDTKPCQQICKNTEGSYVCSCRDNYVVIPENPSRCESMYSFDLFHVPVDILVPEKVLSRLQFLWLLVRGCVKKDIFKN